MRETEFELTELRYSVHRQFDRLQNLCECLEKAIKEESNRRLIDATRQFDVTEDEEERAFVSVRIEDGLFEVEHDFPRIMRYSLFVGMMSLTEASLVRLCRVARYHLEMADAFEEKGSNVIQRAIEYLQADAGLNISGLLYYKKLANNLRELRNTITHSEGCITGRTEEESIRAYCPESATVTIDKRHNLVLSERFVSNNAHVMRNLFVLLCEKLRQKLTSDAVK